MKISFQYPARVLTGYRDFYPAEVNEYDDGGRIVRNYKVGDRVYFNPVYGVRLKTAIVFDRELFIARRIKAVGRLALLTTALVVSLPLIVLAHAAQLASKALDATVEKISDGLEAAGALPGDTLGEQFGINWKDLAS